MDCKECPNRTYSSINGAAECNNCLFGLSSRPGSTSCDVCDYGFYDAQTTTSEVDCVRCPNKGAACPVNTSLQVDPKLQRPKLSWHFLLGKAFKT